jgi:hypothetical protein
MLNTTGLHKELHNLYWGGSTWRMGSACSTHDREGKCIDSLVLNLNESDHQEI